MTEPSTFARRVRAAKPREKKYEVRDDVVSGLALSIQATGVRTFFLARTVRGRRCYATVGSADAMTIPEARREARRLIASYIEPGKTDNGPRTPGHPMTDFAAEFLERYARHWKPSTLEASAHVVRNQILPAFGHMTVDAIAVEHVRGWFASMAATPGSANRAMPTLSVMMRMAELWGYRRHNSNPCKNTRRYKTQARERFLTAEETARLNAVLTRDEFRCLDVVAIARVDTPNWRTVRGTAVALSQGGEFAFVILALGVSSSLMEGRTADMLIVAVTLSMAATPLAFKAGDWLNARLEGEPEPEYERHIEEENRVIIAGFGRVGQIVGRILRLRRIGFTALETSAEQVDFVRRFGNKVYYGDASRVELLRAARADKAVLFVLAIEDVERSLATARAVRKHFPHLTIFARARNRQHAYALMDLGIDRIVRDTFHSSLELAEGILKALGIGALQSRQTVETFRDHDTARLIAQHGIAHDTDRMIEETRHWTRELEEMFAEDERESTEPRL